MSAYAHACFHHHNKFLNLFIICEMWWWKRCALTLTLSPFLCHLMSGPWKRKKRTGTEGKVDREADNVWSKGLRACAPHGVHFPQFLLSHNVCKSEATIDGQSTKKQRNKGTYLPVNLSLRSTQCVTIQSLFFFFLGPQHTKYKRLRDRPRNRKRIKETECLSLRLRPAHKRL